MCHQNQIFSRIRFRCFFPTLESDAEEYVWNGARLGCFYFSVNAGCAPVWFSYRYCSVLYIHVTRNSAVSMCYLPDHRPLIDLCGAR